MVSFCGTIQHSYDSLDDLKDCKNSTFVSPIHMLDFLEAADYKNIFHSKNLKKHVLKYTHADFIKTKYATDDKDFDIVTTFGETQISL